MGTPPFAVPSLDALAACSDLVGVVSQPDRPQGRGLRSAPSPVAASALARGVPLLRPAKLRDPEVMPTLQAWAPDVIVVAAYGKILPAAILALPRLAPLNVHASLLPRHRGAAPIAAAILAGDLETGITIMLMSEGMDEGDVLLQTALPIAPDDTTATLTERLAALGGTALSAALGRVRAGGLVATPQDASLATYAPRLTKEAGRVRWDEPASLIARRVRAFTPWPSAFALWRGKTIKILAARADNATEAATAAAGEAGTISDVGATIHVRTGAGAIELLRVQPEGKTAMSAAAFAAGARLVAGDRFD